MFGRNDFVENVKSALAAVDCDMGGISQLAENV